MSFDTDLAEIRRLLTEAYEHAFQFDGSCKSSEGAITVHYPPFFWSHGANEEPCVEVYSYVLGPNRSHWFDSSTKALEAVRGWHAEEMARCGDCGEPADSKWCCNDEED